MFLERPVDERYLVQWPTYADPDGEFEVLVNSRLPVHLFRHKTPRLLQAGAFDPCFWWRRGRVELPVQKDPQIGCATSLFGGFFLAPWRHHRRSLCGDSRFFLGRRYRRGAVRIPDLWRLTSPIPGMPESRRSRFRRLGPVDDFCQLFFATGFTREMASSACNPLRNAPVEPARPLAYFYCPTAVSKGSMSSNWYHAPRRTRHSPWIIGSLNENLSRTMESCGSVD